MKGLRIGLGVVLGLAALFIVGGLLLPRRVQVSRARDLAAPRERIYPLLASLKNGWPKFSPFGSAKDPQIKEVYSGPELGAGATETFSGGHSPKGSMTLTRADPASGVAFDIDLEGGVVVRGDISFAPQGAGTHVVWADEVDLGHSLSGHWMGLLLPKMLGAGIDEALDGLDRAIR